MRIVGGALRGRRLVAPAGTGTRPTSERLRQAVFDMLGHAQWARRDGRPVLDGAVVLDVFAGTGALGLEALSRGAAQVVFIERDGAALAALAANVAALGVGARCVIERGDATRPGAGARADVVFLDPPYAAGLLEAALAGLAGRMDDDTLVVAELARDAPPPPLRLLAERAHGAGRMVFGHAAPGR